MNDCDGNGTVVWGRDIFDEDGDYVDTEENFEDCEGCEACK